MARESGIAVMLMTVVRPLLKQVLAGYGLDLDSERKLLRVATRLRDDYGFRVQRTFLGAHALPPEYKDRADDYIDLVCETMLPALAAEGLVDASALARWIQDPAARRDHWPFFWNLVMLELWLRQLGRPRPSEPRRP